MLLALPAAEAWRRDIGVDQVADQEVEAYWLTLSASLQHAASLPAFARRGTLVNVVRLATRGGTLLEPTFGDDASAIDLAVAAVEHSATAILAMEDAARFQLAFATWDAVLRLLPVEKALLRGRALAYQGRIARRLDELATAHQRYAAVQQLGRQRELSELTARADVGFGLLAQGAGNFPEARRRAEDALKEPGVAVDTRVAAHEVLMIGSGVAGDYDSAAEHAWAAFRESGAQDSVRALINFSETLLQAGYPAEALRGFGAALASPHILPREVLPALGGAAVAAARALPRTQAVSLVAELAERIEYTPATHRLVFEYVGALADLGDAYIALRDARTFIATRDRGLALAEIHRYHQLVHRLSSQQIPLSPTDRVHPSPPDGLRPEPVTSAPSRPVLQEVRRLVPVSWIADALDGAAT